MSAIAQSFGIGITLGIVLFFVFAYLGWIDKLLISLDHWFR